jgi:hypothetical protein
VSTPITIAGVILFGVVVGWLAAEYRRPAISWAMFAVVIALLSSPEAAAWAGWQGGVGCIVGYSLGAVTRLGVMTLARRDS